MIITFCCDFTVIFYTSLIIINYDIFMAFKCSSVIGTTYFMSLGTAKVSLTQLHLELLLLCF